MGSQSSYACSWEVVSSFNVIEVSAITQDENNSPGHEVIKLFSCSTQLSTKFIMLINFKMPTAFMSMLNATSESLKQEKSVFFSSKVFMSILNYMLS